MKRMLFALLLLYAAPAYSQVGTADTPIVYTGVITVEGVSASNLYSRARAWFATAFRNSKAVMQMEDATAGRLIGKANFIFLPRGLAANSIMRGPVDYTVEIMVKDGRYWYKISDFYHNDTPTPGSGRADLGLLTSAEEYPRRKKGQMRSIVNNNWEELKRQASSEARSLITSLQKAMNSSTNKEEEW